MTTAVDVWEGDLKVGNLPPICALTGEPTSGRRQVHFQSAPRWIGLLIFLGVLPFILGWLLTRRVANGFVPISPAASHRLTRQRAVALAICIGVPAAVLATAAGVSIWSAITAGILVTVGFTLALVALVTGLLWIRAVSVRGYVGEPGPWGRWVRLWNVSPAFAAAVLSMYDERARTHGDGFPPTVGVPPVSPLANP